MVYAHPGTHPGEFEIQMDHLISAGQPDLIIINKKENLPYWGLRCFG